MTTHRLTKTGGRSTACGLTVPSIIGIGKGDKEWEDGDEDDGLCPDGCWPAKHVTTDGFDLLSGETTMSAPAPRPSAPKTEPLKRYDVFFHKRVDGKKVEVLAGSAREREDRDGSIVVMFDELPFAPLVIRPKGVR